MRVVAAVLVVAALLAVPRPPAPRRHCRVGEDDGVRIVRERGAIVVVFTPSAEKLWRRVAGRRVRVYCIEFLEDGTAEGGLTHRAPKRGRRIRTGDLTRGIDYCDVSLETRSGRRPIAAIPLTQRGAVYVDERERTIQMMSILLFAGLLAEERHLPGAVTAEQLLDSLPRLARSVVPLAGPTETPAPGKVGYWSDGAQHVAAVSLSASGRRLFIEGEGDVLHTNVADYIYSLD
jgi:hypothetical protein